MNWNRNPPITPSIYSTTQHNGNIRKQKQLLLASLLSPMKIEHKELTWDRQWVRVLYVRTLIRPMEKYVLEQTEGAALTTIFKKLHKASDPTDYDLYDDGIRAIPGVVTAIMTGITSYTHTYKQAMVALSRIARLANIKQAEVHVLLPDIVRALVAVRVTRTRPDILPHGNVTAKQAEELHLAVVREYVREREKLCEEFRLMLE